VPIVENAEEHDVPIARKPHERRVDFVRRDGRVRVVLEHKRVRLIERRPDLEVRQEAPDGPERELVVRRAPAAPYRRPGIRPHQVLDLASAHATRVDRRPPLHVGKPERVEPRDRDRHGGPSSCRG
jgi:hypothetical protein